MTGKHHLLLPTVQAGMELTWLYALAAFIATATLQRPFPLSAAVATFFLASLSVRTRWLPVRGWRILYAALFHLLGLPVAAAAIVYRFTDSQLSFFNTQWLGTFFQQSRDPMEWIFFILIGLLIIIFWVSGVAFGRRQHTYFNVSRRFDLGVTAFFALFLIRLLLAYKGGIHVRDPVSTTLVFPFFIFGLMALGMVNQQAADSTSYLSGFKGAGMIIGFAVVILGFGAALALVLLPYLTVAAEAGYSALKTTTAPLGPVIVAILKLFLGRSRMRQDQDETSGGHDAPQMETLLHGNDGLNFFSWVLLGFIAIALIMLMCLGLWYLLRWLKREFRFSHPSGSALRWWLTKVLQVWTYLSSRFKWIMGMLRGHVRAVQLFGSLVRWGRFSGVVRRTAETPLEYGLRLGGLFPGLRWEIDTIVEAYHREVFAEEPLGGEHFAVAKAAWRRLRNPCHWPHRIRVGFFGGG